MTSKPRIAWFTQHKPETVSGRFSAVMLPHLASSCEIEVFTDSFDTFFGLPSHHYLSAFRRHQKKPFDVHFYQVENGRGGHFMRSALGLHPGVTLFHDFLMTDFGPDPLTNSPWSVMVDKFRDRSLGWPERFKEFPRTGVIAEREAGLTVVPFFSSIRSHGEYQRAIRRSVGAGISSFIPLPVADNGIQRCDYSPSVLHIGFCGSPRIEHRAHKLFHALHQARVPYKLFWLLDPDEEVQAKELIHEFRVGSVEFVLGRTPDRWQAILKDIHLSVHTLFSVFGSPGYYFPQSLMGGKAVLLTRFADSENIPEEIAFQIDPGETESAQISAVLQAVHSDPKYLNNTAGREYALENHEVSVVVQEFLQGLESAMPALKNAEQGWGALSKDAVDHLIAERYNGIDAWGKESLQRTFNELGWR